MQRFPVEKLHCSAITMTKMGIITKLLQHKNRLFQIVWMNCWIKSVGVDEWHFNGCCFILSGGQLLKRSIIAAGLLFASSTNVQGKLQRILSDRKEKCCGIRRGNLTCHEYGKRLIIVSDLTS